MATTKDNVVFAVSTDEARAIQGFQKLMEKQKQLDQGAKKTSASMRKQKQASDDGAASMRKLSAGALAAAGGIGSVSAAITTGLAAGKQYKDLLDQIGDQANETSKGMRSLRSILPQGVQGDMLFKQVAAAGAQFGLKPNMAADLAEPIISALNQGDTGILDKNELTKIYGAMIASMQATRIGLPAEAAGKTELSGATRGMRPGEATGLLLEAAGLSGWNKQEFAGIIPGLAQWQDMRAGLAGGVAISQTYTDAGVSREMAQAAARVLGPAGATHPLVEKYGLQGMSEVERVNALEAIGAREGKGATADARVGDFAAKLGGVAGVDQQVARALQAIITNAGAFRSAYGALQQGDPRQVTRQLLATNMSDPALRAGYLAEQSSARAEATAFMGPQAGAAREETALRQEIGASLQAAGWSAGVDPQTGEATWLGRMAQWMEENMGPPTGGGSANFRRGASMTGTVEGGERENKQLLERIASATEKMATNQAPQGGRPSPPVQPRNAQI